MKRNSIDYITLESIAKDANCSWDTVKIHVKSLYRMLEEIGIESDNNEWINKRIGWGTSKHRPNSKRFGTSRTRKLLRWLLVKQKP